MPFEPTSAFNFYSDMISNFTDEWDKLFIIWVKSLSYINGEPVRNMASFEVIVGEKNITSGTKTIINDILIYCSNK